MNQSIKLVTRTLALAILGLIFACATTPRAFADAPAYTYVFTASTGQPLELNGSTITIQNDQVIAFDFIDSVAGSPFTSSLAAFSVGITAGSTGWSTGEFTAYDLEGTSGATTLEGLAMPNSLSVEPLDETSATGTWNLSVPGVPDNSSTFALLLGALAAMAAVSYAHRARQAAAFRR
jgi:hypothetical protein